MGDLHVEFPLIAIMQDAPRLLSRPLNGRTLTATFTEDMVRVQGYSLSRSS